jgi:hypothetical protein
MNSPCHQDRDSFATISGIEIMGSGTRGQTCLSTARPYEPLAEFLSQHNTQAELRPVGSALRLFGEVSRAGTYLFDRQVPVDIHRAGSGRNWVDPVTKHGNAGCYSELVAHFLPGLHEPLWLWREHYVFARISSKRRCAKCQHEHDTRASNRRTAQATKPVFYSHTLIVIPVRILRKLI